MSTADPNPEKYILFSRALKHFANRLHDLQNDDSVKLGNSIIDDDMKDIADNALHMSEKFDGNKERHWGIFQDNYIFIKSALEVYIKDLETGKKSLLDTLGCSDLEMLNIDNAISLSKEYQNKYFKK